MLRVVAKMQEKRKAHVPLNNMGLCIALSLCVSESVQTRRLLSDAFLKTDLTMDRLIQG